VGTFCRTPKAAGPCTPSWHRCRARLASMDGGRLLTGAHPLGRKLWAGRLERDQAGTLLADGPTGRRGKTRRFCGCFVHLNQVALQPRSGFYFGVLPKRVRARLGTGRGLGSNRPPKQSRIRRATPQRLPQQRSRAGQNSACTAVRIRRHGPARPVPLEEGVGKRVVGVQPNPTAFGCKRQIPVREWSWGSTTSCKGWWGKPIEHTLAGRS